MNKPAIIFLGLLSGLISVLFFDELLKLLTAVILIHDHTELLINGFKFSIILSIPGKQNFYSYAMVLLTPLMGSILFIEASMIWLNKTISDKIRSYIIIFQLVNIGYLIYTIFILLFSVMLKSAFSTDWQLLFSSNNLSFNQQLIFVLLITIILLSYMNILAKRLKKSIPVISRK